MPVAAAATGIHTSLRESVVVDLPVDRLVKLFSCNMTADVLPAAKR